MPSSARTRRRSARARTWVAANTKATSGAPTSANRSRNVPTNKVGMRTIAATVPIAALSAT